MVDEKSQLLGLARKKFGERSLSPGEEKLFRSVEAGEEALASTKDGTKNDLARSQDWTSERIVRAECLAWLCIDIKASQFVNHVGLRISGMRIDGILDMRGAKIGFPIRISSCVFTEVAAFLNVDLPFLSLSGCHCKGISADGIRVHGSLFLRDKFTSEGEVRLAGAAIDGNLECDGAQLFNPNGKTLNAQGAKIGGCMFLRKGFTSHGEMRLLGITTGGSFSCRGGQFINPGRVALALERATLGGGVFLSEARCEGEVRFSGADIRGDLDCGKSRFANLTGPAFHADTATIKHDVYFRDSQAEGGIRMVGATIGGNFECDRARLSKPSGTALGLSGTKIEGNLFLREGFYVDGEIDLTGAKIGSHLVMRDFSSESKTAIDLRSATTVSLSDDTKSWPTPGCLLLDGFCYDRIFQDSPIVASSRIDWLDRQPKNKSGSQPYERLAKVLREMGYDRDARFVLIEKNRRRGDFAHFPKLDWWWYKFLGKTIGYGYRPLQALKVAALLTGIGAFVLWLSQPVILPTKEAAFEKNDQGQTVLVNGKPKILETYPTFSPLLFSLESFTPFLKLDQRDNWWPNPAGRTTIRFACLEFVITGTLVRNCLVVHIIMGWIITTLWVGAVTGLVKT